MIARKLQSIMIFLILILSNIAYAGMAVQPTPGAGGMPGGPGEGPEIIAGEGSEIKQESDLSEWESMDEINSEQWDMLPNPRTADMYAKLNPKDDNSFEQFSDLDQSEQNTYYNSQEVLGECGPCDHEYMTNGDNINNNIIVADTYFTQPGNLGRTGEGTDAYLNTKFGTSNVIYKIPSDDDIQTGQESELAFDPETNTLCVSTNCLNSEILSPIVQTLTYKRTEEGNIEFIVDPLATMKTQEGEVVEMDEDGTITGPEGTEITGISDPFTTRTLEDGTTITPNIEEGGFTIQGSAEGDWEDILGNINTFLNNEGELDRSDSHFMCEDCTATLQDSEVKGAFSISINSDGNIDIVTIEGEGSYKDDKGTIRVTDIGIMRLAFDDSGDWDNLNGDGIETKVDERHLFGGNFEIEFDQGQLVSANLNQENTKYKDLTSNVAVRSREGTYTINYVDTIPSEVDSSSFYITDDGEFGGSGNFDVDTPTFMFSKSDSEWMSFTSEDDIGNLNIEGGGEFVKKYQLGDIRSPSFLRDDINPRMIFNIQNNNGELTITPDMETMRNAISLQNDPMQFAISDVFSVNSGDNPIDLLKFNANGVQFMTSEGDLVPMLNSRTSLAYTGENSEFIQAKALLETMDQYMRTGHKAGDQLEATVGSKDVTGEIIGVTRGRIYLDTNNDGEADQVYQENEFSSITIQDTSTRLRELEEIPQNTISYLQNVETTNSGTEKGAEARLLAYQVAEEFDIPQTTASQSQYRVGQEYYVTDSHYEVLNKDSQEIASENLRYVGRIIAVNYDGTITTESSDGNQYISQPEETTSTLSQYGVGDTVYVSGVPYEVNGISYNYDTSQIEYDIEEKVTIPIRDGDYPAESASEEFGSTYVYSSLLATDDSHYSTGNLVATAEVQVFEVPEPTTLVMTEGQLEQDDWFGRFSQDYSDYTDLVQQAGMQIAETQLTEGDISLALKYYRDTISVNPTTEEASKAESTILTIESQRALQNAEMFATQKYFQEMNRNDRARSIIGGAVSGNDPLEFYEQLVDQGVFTRGMAGLSSLSPFNMARDLARNDFVEESNQELTTSGEAISAARTLVENGKATNLQGAINIITAHSAGEGYKIGQTINYYSNVDDMTNDLGTSSEKVITDRFIQDGEWHYVVSNSEGSGKTSTITLDDGSTEITTAAADGLIGIGFYDKYEVSGDVLDEDQGRWPSSGSSILHYAYQDYLQNANELNDAGTLDAIDTEHASFLANDPSIQLGIQMSDMTLTDSERDQSLLEMAKQYREDDNFEGAAMVTRELSKTSTDPTIREEAYELYNEIADPNSEWFNFADESLHGSTLYDVGAEVLNPFAWVAFGAAGKAIGAGLKVVPGGTTLLSTTGKIVKFPSTLIRGSGQSTSALRGFAGQAISIGVEEGAEALAGRIHPAAETFVMALTGGADSIDVMQSNMKQAFKNTEVSVGSQVHLNGEQLSQVYYYTETPDMSTLSQMGDIQELGEGVIKYTNPSSGEVSYLAQKGTEASVGNVISKTGGDVVEAQDVLDSMETAPAYVRGTSEVDVQNGEPVSATVEPDGESWGESWDGEGEVLIAQDTSGGTHIETIGDMETSPGNGYWNGQEWVGETWTGDTPDPSLLKADQTGLADSSTDSTVITDFNPEETWPGGVPPASHVRHYPIGEIERTGTIANQVPEITEGFQQLELLLLEGDTTPSIRYTDEWTQTKNELITTLDGKEMTRGQRAALEAAKGNEDLRIAERAVHDALLSKAGGDQTITHSQLEQSVIDIGETMGDMIDEAGVSSAILLDNGRIRRITEMRVNAEGDVSLDKIVDVGTPIHTGDWDTYIGMQETAVKDIPEFIRRIDEMDAADPGWTSVHLTRDGEFFLIAHKMINPETDASLFYCSRDTLVDPSLKPDTSEFSAAKVESYKKIKDEVFGDAYRASTVKTQDGYSTDKTTFYETYHQSFETKMQDDSEFKAMVERTYEQLKEAGYTSRNKVRFTDTAYAGSIPVFLEGVMHHYNPEIETSSILMRSQTSFLNSELDGGAVESTSKTGEFAGYNADGEPLLRHQQFDGSIDQDSRLSIVTDLLVAKSTIKMSGMDIYATRQQNRARAICERACDANLDVDMSEYGEGVPIAAKTIQTHPTEILPHNTDPSKNLFVKSGEEHTLRSELIGQRLYTAMGLPTPKADLITGADGNLKIAMENLEGFKAGGTSLPEGFQTDATIQKGVLVSALVNDYDRTPWNFMFKDNEVEFIDFGGSMNSRAQGGHKGIADSFDQTQMDDLMTNPQFGGDVNEAYASALQDRTTMRRSARQMAALSDDTIDTIVKEAYQGADVSASKARLQEWITELEGDTNPNSVARSQTAVQTYRKILEDFDGDEAAYYAHALKMRRDDIIGMFSQ